MRAFKTYLKNKRKVSPATIEAYLRDLALLSAFCGKHPKDASGKDVQAFIGHMQSAGRSAATINRTLSSLHVYYGYLVSTGKRPTDPTEKMQRPRAEEKLPVILTVEETNHLLSAPQGDSPLALRDRAILELLYATGMTVSELLGLDIEHLNLRRRTLSLVRFGRKRTVPFGKPCAAALSNYLKNARPLLFRGSGAVALFVSCNGTRISRQGLWKLLKKYKEAAGIDKEVTPHMLRHSFAAHLLENGADRDTVSDLMGFIDPSSAAIYTRLVENKIMDIYEKAHPRAKFAE